jgi:drug/metabolite transporter (DMT)-like permease
LDLAEVAAGLGDFGGLGKPALHAAIRPGLTPPGARPTVPPQQETAMPRRDRIDAFGAGALLAVMLLLAFNQVIVKVVNEGLQPVFFAGVRSALAVPVVAAWLWFRGRPPRLTRAELGPGLLIGTVFALEFLCLFMALDLTTVSRASILFYSMPVWMALLAHFGLPGERITRLRAAGLVLAFAGTALAILDRTAAASGQASLAGDLLALGGALGWAGTAFVARRPVMAAAGPEKQLFWMVLVSAPILLLAAPFFGPFIRELQPIHLFWLVFQSVVVVSGGFIAWLWLLSVYPASSVASFSFLTPILGISLGWLLLDEPLGAQTLIAGLMVAVGITLINRRV